MTLITQPPYEWSEIRSWLVYLTDRLNSGAGDLSQLTGTIFSMYDQYPNWLYSQTLYNYYHNIYSYSTETPQIVFFKKSARTDTDTTGNTVIGKILGKYYDTNVETEGSNIKLKTNNDAGNFKSYITFETKDDSINSTPEERVKIDEKGQVVLSGELNRPSIVFDNKTAPVTTNNSMWFESNHLNVNSNGQKLFASFYIMKDVTEKTITNSVSVFPWYDAIFIQKDFFAVGRIIRFKFVLNATATNTTATNRHISFDIVIDGSARTLAAFDIGGGATINNGMIFLEQDLIVRAVSGNNYTFAILGQFYTTTNNQIRNYLNAEYTQTISSSFSIRHRSYWSVAQTTNTFTVKLVTAEVL